MRIALISSPMLLCPPTNYGGSELIVYNLACALTAKGHKVVLFAPKGSSTPPNGFLVETPEPALKVQCDWLDAEQKMFDVYSKYITDEFDVVHAHGWFLQEFMLNHKNVWHTHHGHINSQWFNQTKSTARSTIRIVVISQFMRQMATEQGFGDICKYYCYNGIDLDKYKFGDKHNSGRLLFVGRIDRFKQPHAAIEVAKKMNVGIDIVGGTFIQDEQYLQYIRSLCDGVQVVMHDNASHEKKIALMQSAKCLIFPSQMGEPFGLVPCEAMACGCPVVALNDGAVEEVVQEGGIVCDVFDKKFMNGQISYFLKQNPVDALIEAVKKVDTISPLECRKNAEKFSRETMSDNYLRIYK